jgi:hypothetical protein
MARVLIDFLGQDPSLQITPSLRKIREFRQHQASHLVIKLCSHPRQAYIDELKEFGLFHLLQLHLHDQPDSVSGKLLDPLPRQAKPYAR